MTQQIYAVYGASGFGREVMPLARQQVLQEGGTPDQLLFVDDNPTSSFINGHKVVRYTELTSMKASAFYVAIAIAESPVRQKIFEHLIADGINVWQIKADNVVMLDDIKIDSGAILSPFVTITSNITIGKSFHANLYSYVAHDCQIGDFVTFAPRVMCNGNVVIKDHAYIATGAIIRQGKPGKPIVIGERAVVGMGAVVTKNVPDGTTVIGNPAAPLSKKALRR
ncbi:MAG: NeuD/PglB/VioB family sugar acetyltransferase [Candidatus Electrothrix aestuarii]|uniref:NeuD/PglB/VioB family sugar acetyltransferase n=1 Tax=Candidatus Electrothrix aestuarii TaxID=3062594 RepID=A0AAU8LZ60_9BACT|nr:NeuD/PglB/VioB family sugar acetyltransferase [Candidatus Electrothrix aestuarii]